MEKEIESYIRTLLSKRNVVVPVELVERFANTCRLRKIALNGGALVLFASGIPKAQCFYLG